MRSPTSNKASWIAACAAGFALLVLVLASGASASEAGNVFGGAAQSSTQAAKPASTAKSPGVTKSSGAAQPASSSAHAAQGTSSKATGPAKGATVQLSAAEKAKLLQEARAKLGKQLRGTQTTASTATTATAETSSKTSAPMIMALVAGVLLLGGIAFVIVRDARSVAPVVEGMASGGTRNPEGRLRKRRAQAKAARRQRKRHRRR
jgi:hypothetical protein